MLYIQTKDGKRKIVEIEHKITSQNVMRVLQQVQTEIDILINKLRLEDGLKLEYVSLNCAAGRDRINDRKHKALDYSANNNLIDIYMQVKDSVDDCFVGAEDPIVYLRFVKDESIKSFSNKSDERIIQETGKFQYIWDPQDIIDAIIEHKDDLIEIDFEDRQDLRPLVIQGLPVLSKLERLKTRNCNVPVSSLQEIIKQAPRLHSQYFRSGMFERTELINMFTPQPCVFRAPPREDAVAQVNTSSKKSNSDTIGESCRFCMTQ
jgi:hypothetical protein